MTMHKIVDVGVELDILGVNRRNAQHNLEMFQEKSVQVFEFMGSIGSGKTLLIERISEVLLAKGKKVGAVAGDVAGKDDYNRFLKHKIEAININTGKECHLEAHAIEHAVDKLALDDLDVVFIENVGNLVCPADFPLGAHKRLVVISVTEGDDMVRKHPMIFGTGDMVIINKTDLADAVEVDPNVILEDLERINPNIVVCLTDAKHGQGIDKVIQALGIQ